MPIVPSLLAKIQSFLFHYGEPVSVEKIARVLAIEKKECLENITLLSQHLNDDPSCGLCLIIINDKVQLSTKPEFHEVRKHIVSEEWKEDITPAAQETLSIIGYLGPISKIMIDYIRGVNSGFILRNLLIRGLIERTPSKDRKNSHDYFVTTDFLRHMGILDIKDLPEYEKYHSLINDFALSETEKRNEVEKK